MLIDNAMKIIKNFVRWFGMFFFMTGGYVCLTEYNAPFVAILWFWTAIIVSPLPTRLRDWLELKISDRTISAVTWTMIAVSIVALFIGVL